MRTLTFVVVLLALSSALALSKNKLKAKATAGGDTAHNLAGAIFGGDDLAALAVKDDLNNKFWNDFFAKYDKDGVAGLSKDEFHRGIDDWTMGHGFGHQSKPGTDGIFDDIDTDHSGLLTIEEASNGSRAIFQWYKNILQNVQRGLARKLYSELAASRCQDIRNTIAGFTAFPSVAVNIATSWDYDHSGLLDRSEVIRENDQLISMLFLEPVSAEEKGKIFDKLDTDHDGLLSYKEGTEFIYSYLNAIVDDACQF